MDILYGNPHMNIVCCHFRATQATSGNAESKELSSDLELRTFFSDFPIEITDNTPCKMVGGSRTLFKKMGVEGRPVGQLEHWPIHADHGTMGYDGM